VLVANTFLWWNLELGNRRQFPLKIKRVKYQNTTYELGSTQPKTWMPVRPADGEGRLKRPPLEVATNAILKQLAGFTQRSPRLKQAFYRSDPGDEEYRKFLKESLENLKKTEFYRNVHLLDVRDMTAKADALRVH